MGRRRQQTFYMAIMSLNRFKCFLRCVRFDNCHTRKQRKINDKFAAISEIWGLFLGSIQRVYIPDDCITVDEQLVGYRGPQVELTCRQNQESMD